MPYPSISQNPSQQAAYEAMREDGQSHKMAEMLASRRIPGVRTDATFMAKQRVLRPKLPASYYRKAREAGVNTDANVWCGDIARFPGDPEAWVDGRGDVKRACEREGWGTEDEVHVKARPVEVPDDDGPYQAAEDLVKKEVVEMGRADPGLVDTPKAREKTLNETRERLSGG